jgi:hypothetical protein
MINDLPRMIAFCGNRGAGKDEACAYLNRKYGYVSRGFSDPLYTTLKVINPIIQVNGPKDAPAYRLYNDLVKEYGVDFVKRNYQEVRRLLQVLGTECGRDVHGRDVWTHAMDIASRADKLTAIRDLRFPEEANFIRSCGGTLVFISSFRETPADPSHVSEISLDYRKVADVHITNNGSLEDLGNEIENVIASWQSMEWGIV